MLRSEKCCCCCFSDFIPCFHSSLARSQTQGYSMSTTCPCKDRPQATAGAMVPGVSAALSVEEVRGQDLVSGLPWGLYPHTEGSVSACCPLQLLPAVSCWKTPQVSSRGAAKVLSREGHTWSHNRTVSHALSCLIFHVLVLRLVTRIC